MIGEEPIELFDGVFSTGMMGEIGEQSVLIPTEKGWVLLTGCAHAGILSIVQRAEEMTGEVPRLVVGGFHLFKSSEEEISETIFGLQRLGVEYLCPTHCTGERARELFQKAFGEVCLIGGVGALIEG